MRSKKTKINRKYIHFSEETNALDFLEQAYFYISDVEKTPRNWKWIIISLHGSLYGFAVCAVQGTNSETVTYKTKSGQRRLVSFEDIIKWVQDKNRMTWTIASKELSLNADQKKSIDMLSKQFRNSFEHYTPMSWSIEIHGFPQMTMDILDIIRFLALDTGNYLHLNVSQRRQLKSLIYQSKRSLKKSLIYKESVIARRQYLEKNDE